MARAPLAVALFFLVVGSACGSSDAGSSVRPSLETAPQETTTAAAAADLGGFNKKKAMTHVRKLAKDIGVRVKASRNEKKGARYIKRKFERFGYNTKVQRFKVAEGRSRNVVAWWPDSKKYGFVVGAHMDSVPGAPGANDNASGVGVVLEIARLSAGKRPAKLARFVAFGAEEAGTDGSHHDGSRAYVRRLGKKGRKRLGGMLSVDMIADGRPLLIGNSNIAGDVVAETVYKKVDAAGINANYTTFCDCSDHGPFEHAGIPASLMWSGDEPNYHSPTDVVKNTSSKDLQRTGRAVKAFLEKLNQKMIDRFRKG